MSFRFKQFYIQDDCCAMKVGTDGVLLGAWVPVADKQQRVLDIGTGSGLIALMIAQQCSAQIDAIDIDEPAVRQANENIASSPWPTQLHAYLASLQSWAAEPYDLIVSNPPYFQNSLKNPDAGRHTARHTDTLAYEELIVHSVRLLKEGGLLALILPAEAESEIRAIAGNYGLWCKRITHVFSKNGKTARRVMLCFEKGQPSKGEQTATGSIVLEDDKGGRSRDYQELTKDFYL